MCKHKQLELLSKDSSNQEPINSNKPFNLNNNNYYDK